MQAREQTIRNSSISHALMGEKVARGPHGRHGRVENFYPNHNQKVQRVCELIANKFLGVEPDGSLPNRPARAKGCC